MPDFLLLYKHTIYILQVSYTPAGMAENVLNHFQLYPSENNLALALVAVVKEYGWRQLSILTQNEQPFIQVSGVHVVYITTYCICASSIKNFIDIKRMYRDGTGEVTHTIKVALITQHNSHITIPT